MIFLIFAIASAESYPSNIPEKPSGWDHWTFDQKVAWRGQHLDPRIPYVSYADKLKVKEIVGNSILAAKTLFATDNYKLIFTQALPEKYVMKANNASGRGLLVMDKKILARKKRDVDFVPILATDSCLRYYARKWLSEPIAPDTEHHYSLIKPTILFEEYLENITMDIELFCFNGKVELIEILFIDSYKTNPVISFYDADWNLLKTTHPIHCVRNEAIDRPIWLDKLFEFVQQYTQDIDQVRVDFYLNGEDIYFGEFTFTTGGEVVPATFQKTLGSCWKFPE